MKKIIFVIMGMLITCGIHAQQSGLMKIGAKAGLNLANIGGEETDNAMKLASHWGAFAEYYFHKPWDVQAEFLLSFQGHAPATEFDNRLNLVCINIPLFFRYMPKEKINLHIGPQLGFILSAKAKFGDLTYDVNDEFKFFDLGLALGGGYEFELLDRETHVTLRYIHGLTNISEGGSSRFNRVLQLGLGIVLFDYQE